MDRNLHLKDKFLKMFRYIEPEVPGGLGSESIIDPSVHPPIIKKLQIEFSGWLGDDIIEVFPCFAVTDVLRDKIESEKLSGIIFDNLNISKSGEFFELFPSMELPQFYWAKIIGKFQKSDFFIGKDLRLCITENAFNLLCLFNLKNATFEELDSVG